MLSPLKKRATSWSDDCQGSPRARTTVSLSTTSALLLWGVGPRVRAVYPVNKRALLLSPPSLLCTHQGPVSYFCFITSGFENN